MLSFVDPLKFIAVLWQSHSKSLSVQGGTTKPLDAEVVEWIFYTEVFPRARAVISWLWVGDDNEGYDPNSLYVSGFCPTPQYQYYKSTWK